MPVTPHDRAAFLRAICTHPDDDLPRLAFADWLEEGGETEYAEFIRVGVALANVGHLPDGTVRTGCKGDDQREELLLRRERALWRAFEPSLRETLPGRSVGVARVRQINRLTPELQGGSITYLYGRGFLDEIRLPLAALLEHAASLFAAHPITRVVLTGREPYVSVIGRTQWFWFDTSIQFADPLSHLPAEIFQMLGTQTSWPLRHRVYDERQIALDALSLACVQHGRALADLPPL